MKPPKAEKGNCPSLPDKEIRHKKDEQLAQGGTY